MDFLIRCFFLVNLGPGTMRLREQVFREPVIEQNVVIQMQHTEILPSNLCAAAAMLHHKC